MILRKKRNRSASSIYDSNPNTDFFKYNGAIAWNNLPYEAKVAESLSSLKRTINGKRRTLEFARPVVYTVILLSFLAIVF